MRTLKIVLISLFLAGCGITSQSVSPTQTEEPTQAASPTSIPSSTSTPDLRGTQIAEFGATQTAQVAKAYATRKAQSNQATSLLDEILRNSSEIEGIDISNPKLVFGPESGSLTHAIDNKVTASNANVSLKNFIVHITFINPYDTSTTGTWDYGILFRNTYENNQYRLTILSNQSWTLVDASTWTNIFSKNDKYLTAKAREENSIWLIVQDTKAFLFINGSYSQLLDVSTRITPGDISPATGLYYGNETDKKTTRFHDFVIWSLP